MTDVILRTEGLKKNFGKLEVLKGISTSITKGEVVSIIGPSGGGKSTFLRCLNLLEEPTEGKVYFKGQSGRFAAPLKECIFYTAITASPRMASGKLNKQYNPAIEKVLVSMAAATIRTNATRTKHLRFDD